jgi:uncharacterized cupredoxin-like copper-binding protein
MRGLNHAMLLAVLLSQAGQAQAPDWGKAQTIAVELSSFKYTPETLTLRRGMPYRIHLTNSASGGHDFVAKAFFAESSIAAEDQAKIRKGGVELGGGESVDVRLVPNQAGSYKVHCSHFMHSGFGMKGSIIVQ